MLIVPRQIGSCNMDSVRGPEIRPSMRSIRCGAVDINKSIR